MDTHIEVQSKTRTPTLLRLKKKRRFQCKDCRKVTGAETLIVEKNHQISNLVRKRSSQLLTEKMSLTDIARRLRMSTSTVYRKLDRFTFKRNILINSQRVYVPGISFGVQERGIDFLSLRDYETNKALYILQTQSSI